MNNIAIVQHTSCTGCMLCQYECPTGAIAQTISKNGFRFPIVDEKKCSKCGMCIQKCPALETRPAMASNIPCYAAMAEDILRLHSSSGGAFSVIAKYIISHGGAVCGAAFGDDNKRAQHRIINTVDDLHFLQKSKYIQSDISFVFAGIHELLTQNRLVLFVGTPCQCAAIKNAFGENKNLFLVDILCMGVASQECFDKYIAEEYPGEQIINVDFRYKQENGWNQNLQMLIETDKRRTVIPAVESSYFCAFLKNISTRKCCKSCSYAGKARCGDLTLGDFWGIGSIDPTLDDGKGTSLLIANTAKGQLLIAALSGFFLKCKEVPLSYAIPFNVTLARPTKVNPKSCAFWDEYTVTSLRNNLHKLIDDTADCGIINYWWSNDHGAILTAFALQQVLKKMGYTSKLINLTPKNYERDGKISQSFELSHLNTTYEVYDYSSLPSLNNKFGCFIVGSDQVFRAEWVSNDFFLQFADEKIPKFAFSASFGIDNLNVSYLRKLGIGYLLSRFNNISVREKSGVDLCKSVSGVDAQWIIDPVFLLDRTEYENLIDIQSTPPPPLIRILFLLCSRFNR